MPFIAEIDGELVDLEVRRKQNVVVVDITADKWSGGITVEECSTINKKVARALEDAQWFGDDFTVEVSSPGLDRVLKTARDFERAIGRIVRIHLNGKVEGKLEYQGAIAEVSADTIILAVRETKITIPLAMITKAVQVIL